MAWPGVTSKHKMGRFLAVSPSRVRVKGKFHLKVLLNREVEMEYINGFSSTIFQEFHDLN